MALNKLDRIQLLCKLGILNVIQVVWYRIQIRSGWFRRTLPVSHWNGEDLQSPFSSVAPKIWPFENESVFLFGHHEKSLAASPNWLANDLERTEASRVSEHWSYGADFDSNVGDIKGIWEMSRFQGLLNASWKVATVQSRESEIAMEQAIALLNDWCIHNPPNRGPNWKCAQEVSIRLMHFLYSDVLCNLREKKFASIDNRQIFIEAHLSRIFPTTHYAKAQDNNHGTSEAAALYCGGLWVEYNSLDEICKRKAAKTKNSGRRLLENRAAKLIMSDGTFSQYSVVYHRMMLDTLVFAELWRRCFRDRPFSSRFYVSAAAATQWLIDLVDVSSFDCPNIGANDGAHLFNASEISYRNFQTSADVARHVFFGKRPANEKKKHSFYKSFQKELEQDFTVATVTAKGPATTTSAPGGFVRLGNKVNWVVLRLPGYRFRPPQADALHLDVWCEGVNLCPDAGTFAYNIDEEELDEFAGTRAHNTVCFENKNQMPRVSRFLFGNWLNRVNCFVDRINQKVGCGYTTSKGKSHFRSVEWTGISWLVTDKIEGSFDNAELRWRLADLRWNVVGNIAQSNLAKLIVEIDDQEVILKSEIVRESRFYRNSSLLPAISVSVSQPCVIRTSIIPLLH